MLGPEKVLCVGQILENFTAGESSFHIYFLPLELLRRNERYWFPKHLGWSWPDDSIAAPTACKPDFARQVGVAEIAGRRLLYIVSLGSGTYLTKSHQRKCTKFSVNLELFGKFACECRYPERACSVQNYLSQGQS